MGYAIGVASSKGGVGKSILATNLGVALNGISSQKTAVLDLTPGFGSADLLLDLVPERSWLDLIPVMMELTNRHVELAVSPFKEYLDVLPCPSDQIDPEDWSQLQIRELVNIFQELYTFSVIDTFPGLSDINQKIFLNIDLLLIMLTPDAPALRATARLLDHIENQDLEIRLVLNQFGSGAAVKPNQIQDYLQCQLISVLPIDSRSVWKNVNYGQPCVLQRKSVLGKSIRKLAVKIVQPRK